MHFACLANLCIPIFRTGYSTYWARQPGTRTVALDNVVVTPPRRRDTSHPPAPSRRHVGWVRCPTQSLCARRQLVKSCSYTRLMHETGCTDGCKQVEGSAQGGGGGGRRWRGGLDALGMLCRRVAAASPLTKLTKPH